MEGRGVVHKRKQEVLICALVGFHVADRGGMGDGRRGGGKRPDAKRHNAGNHQVVVNISSRLDERGDLLDKYTSFEHCFTDDAGCGTAKGAWSCMHGVACF